MVSLIFTIVKPKFLIFVLFFVGPAVIQYIPNACVVVAIKKGKNGVFFYISLALYDGL
jgi:hypothetical protein